MSTFFHETHKFGGTSLADASGFIQSASLLPEQQRVLVVVSAMAGVTNQLQSALDAALVGGEFEIEIQSLYQRHRLLINELSLMDQVDLVNRTDVWFENVMAVLTSIRVVRSCSDAERAEVLGLGERCCAWVFNAYIGQKRRSRFLDASLVLTLKRHHGLEHFDEPDSTRRLEGFLAGGDSDVIVVTGFLARNESGQTTLLQRNGSDVSASVFADLVQSNTLTIWTDQDGIYSCDPKLVSMAFPVPALSYAEAMELAYFGTSIIHPNAIAPAAKSKRRIYIKNTFNPSGNGTLIDAHSGEGAHRVRGLTRIDNIALLTISGVSMMGVAGVSARVFSSLSQAGVSVIMISQASSEQSICLCIEREYGSVAVRAIETEFAYELEKHLLHAITLEDDVAIVAAVGDRMSHHVGIAAQMCRSLAKANVNIRAIAQGSSERNISIVIDHNDLSRALKALHSGFYLAAKTIAVGVIGVGVVGAEFLDQLAAQADRLFEQEQIAFHLRGIMNSKKMLLSDGTCLLSQWRDAFSSVVTKSDMPHWIEHLTGEDYPHAVVIDCTASQEIADAYPDFIRNGLHVITPNKKASSGDIKFYRDVLTQAKRQQRTFLYETTVCAGLPVMTTLQDIVRTGDEVFEIEGVVSGSLNYICSELNQGGTFSQAVFKAQRLGFTEPDPRDDLSGMDVARKMVILARELGLSVELPEVSAVNLVPQALRNVSLSEFMEQLSHYDDAFSQRIASLTKRGGKVTYAGHINVRAAQVRIVMQPINESHPFFHLNATDNMLVFTTHRYHEQPLVVRGPGAGAEVTASGVFADLLRLSSTVSVSI